LKNLKYVMENELPMEAVVGLISALEDVKEGRYTVLTNQIEENKG